MTLEKSLGSDLFQIDVSYYGTGAVITLAGELDVASAPELEMSCKVQRWTLRTRSSSTWSE
jgi:hypothetical protein